MDTDSTTTPHLLIASDRVEGTPVRRHNGMKIGTIERMMVEKESGKVAYAVMTFGGFLGIGKRHLPLPWSMLHYDAELRAYEVDLSDAELISASLDEFDWGERAAEITGPAFSYRSNSWGA